LNVYGTTKPVLGAQFRVYDSDLATVLNSSYALNESCTTSVAGLAAGTYTIRVHCSYGTGKYEFSTGFVAEAKTNDPEPNDSPAIAATLSLTDIRQGHIGFCGGGTCDTNDWYVFTVTHTGALGLTVATDTGVGAYFRLYAVTRDTLLATELCTGTSAQISRGNLQPGSYRLAVVTASGAGSYTVTPSWAPTAIRQDVRKTCDLLPSIYIANHILHIMAGNAMPVQNRLLFPC